ncbi:MAG TPA: ABC transporter permease, partial [Acetobacteraceae bacterium]|nr:ABC transporter permease [Acetobacteraceae bacterium]
MSGYILRRAAQALVVLLVMSFIIYSLIGLMPGDPIDVMLSTMPNITPDQVAQLRHVYGLDQPLLLR